MVKFILRAAPLFLAFAFGALSVVIAIVIAMEHTLFRASPFCITEISPVKSGECQEIVN